MSFTGAACFSKVARPHRGAVIPYQNHMNSLERYSISV